MPRVFSVANERWQYVLLYSCCSIEQVVALRVDAPLEVDIFVSDLPSKVAVTCKVICQCVACSRLHLGCIVSRTFCLVEDRLITLHYIQVIYSGLCKNC